MARHVLSTDVFSRVSNELNVRNLKEIEEQSMNFPIKSGSFPQVNHICRAEDYEILQDSDDEDSDDEGSDNDDGEVNELQNKQHLQWHESSVDTGIKYHKVKYEPKIWDHAATTSLWAAKSSAVDGPTDMADGFNAKKEYSHIDIPLQKKEHSHVEIPLQMASKSSWQSLKLLKKRNRSITSLRTKTSLSMLPTLVLNANDREMNIRARPIGRAGNRSVLEIQTLIEENYNRRQRFLELVHLPSRTGNLRSARKKHVHVSDITIANILSEYLEDTDIILRNKFNDGKEDKPCDEEPCVEDGIHPCLKPKRQRCERIIVIQDTCGVTYRVICKPICLANAEEAERILAAQKEKTLRDMEERKRKAAEERAIREAEIERQRQKEEEKRRIEDEEKARIAAEKQAVTDELDRIKREAEEQARLKEEERMREVQEEQDRIAAELKAIRDEELRIQQEEEELKRIEEEELRRIAEEERQEQLAEEKRIKEELAQAKRKEEDRLRKEAEETARVAAEEKAQREHEVREKKKEEERKRKEEAERKKQEEEEKRQNDEQERQRIVAEKKAKKEAEEKRKLEEQEQKRKAEEEKLQKEEEQRQQKIAASAAKKEALEKAKREEEERIQKAAEEKAKIEEEQRQRKQAEEKAKKEEEAKQKKIEEERIRKENEEIARKEAAEKIRKAEEARKQKEEEIRLKKVEAERKQKEEVEQKRKEEEEKKRKIAEAAAIKKKAEEEKQRKIEEERKRKEAEETAKKAEEEKKKKEAEAKKLAQEEAKRKKEEEVKKQKEAEEKARKAEEERKIKEAAVQKQKEEDEKRRKEEEIRKQKEAVEKARIAEEVRKTKEAEAKKKQEEAEKKRIEEIERKQKEAEEKAKKAEVERVRKEVEETKRKEAAEKLRKENEEQKQKEAEAKAKKETEEKERKEKERKDAEEKKRVEDELKAKKTAEEKSHKEAVEKERQEAAEKVRKEKEEQQRLVAEEKALKAAEAKARKKAEAKAQAEEIERKKIEAEVAARKEAEENARVEAEIKAKKEAEEKAKQEEAERKRIAEEVRQQKETEEKLRKAEETRIRKEREKNMADEKARIVAEIKAKKAAEDKIKKEAAAQLRAEEKERLKKEAAELKIAEKEAEKKRLANNKVKRAEEAEQLRLEKEEKSRIKAEEKKKREEQNALRKEADAKARTERREAAMAFLKQSILEQLEIIKANNERWKFPSQKSLLVPQTGVPINIDEEQMAWLKSLFEKKIPPTPEPTPVPSPPLPPNDDLVYGGRFSIDAKTVARRRTKHKATWTDKEQLTPQMSESTIYTQTEEESEEVNPVVQNPLYEGMTKGLGNAGLLNNMLTELADMRKDFSMRNFMNEFNISETTTVDCGAVHNLGARMGGNGDTYLGDGRDNPYVFKETSTSAETEQRQSLDPAKKGMLNFNDRPSAAQTNKQLEETSTSAETEQRQSLDSAEKRMLNFNDRPSAAQTNKQLEDIQSSYSDETVGGQSFDKDPYEGPAQQDQETAEVVYKKPGKSSIFKLGKTDRHDRPKIHFGKDTEYQESDVSYESAGDGKRHVATNNTRAMSYSSGVDKGQKMLSFSSDIDRKRKLTLSSDVDADAEAAKSMNELFKLKRLNELLLQNNDSSYFGNMFSNINQKIAGIGISSIPGLPGFVNGGADGEKAGGGNLKAGIEEGNKYKDKLMTEGSSVSTSKLEASKSTVLRKQMYEGSSVSKPKLHEMQSNDVQKLEEIKGNNGRQSKPSVGSTGAAAAGLKRDRVHFKTPQEIIDQGSSVSKAKLGASQSKDLLSLLSEGSSVSAPKLEDSINKETDEKQDGKKSAVQIAAVSINVYHPDEDGRDYDTFVPFNKPAYHQHIQHVRVASALDKPSSDKSDKQSKISEKIVSRRGTTFSKEPSRMGSTDIDNLQDSTKGGRNIKKFLENTDKQPLNTVAYQHRCIDTILSGNCCERNLGCPRKIWTGHERGERVAARHVARKIDHETNDEFRVDQYGNNTEEEEEFIEDLTDCKGKCDRKSNKKGKDDSDGKSAAPKALAPHMERSIFSRTRGASYEEKQSYFERLKIKNNDTPICNACPPKNNKSDNASPTNGKNPCNQLNILEIAPLKYGHNLFRGHVTINKIMTFGASGDKPSPDNNCDILKQNGKYSKEEVQSCKAFYSEIKQKFTPRLDMENIKKPIAKKLEEAGIELIKELDNCPIKQGDEMQVSEYDASWLKKQHAFHKRHAPLVLDLGAMANDCDEKCQKAEARKTKQKNKWRSYICRRIPKGDKEMRMIKLIKSFRQCDRDYTGQKDVEIEPDLWALTGRKRRQFDVSHRLRQVLPQPPVSQDAMNVTDFTKTTCPSRKEVNINKYRIKPKIDIDTVITGDCACREQNIMYNTYKNSSKLCKVKDDPRHVPRQKIEVILKTLDDFHWKDPLKLTGEFPLNTTCNKNPSPGEPIAAETGECLETENESNENLTVDNLLAQVAANLCSRRNDRVDGIQLDDASSKLRYSYVDLPTKKDEENLIRYLRSDDKVNETDEVGSFINDLDMWALTGQDKQSLRFTLKPPTKRKWSKLLRKCNRNNIKLKNGVVSSQALRNKQSSDDSYVTSKNKILYPNMIPEVKPEANPIVKQSQFQGMAFVDDCKTNNNNEDETTSKTEDRYSFSHTKRASTNFDQNKKVNKGLRSGIQTFGDMMVKISPSNHDNFPRKTISSPKKKNFIARNKIIKKNKSTVKVDSEIKTGSKKQSQANLQKSVPSTPTFQEETDLINHLKSLRRDVGETEEIDPWVLTGLPKKELYGDIFQPSGSKDNLESHQNESSVNEFLPKHGQIGHKQSKEDFTSQSTPKSKSKPVRRDFDSVLRGLDMLWKDDETGGDRTNLNTTWNRFDAKLEQSIHTSGNGLIENDIETKHDEIKKDTAVTWDLQTPEPHSPSDNVSYNRKSSNDLLNTPPNRMIDRLQETNDYGWLENIPEPSEKTKKRTEECKESGGISCLNAPKSTLNTFKGFDEQGGCPIYETNEVIAYETRLRSESNNSVLNLPNEPDDKTFYVQQYVNTQLLHFKEKGGVAVRNGMSFEEEFKESTIGNKIKHADETPFVADVFEGHTSKENEREILFNEQSVEKRPIAISTEPSPVVDVITLNNDHQTSMEFNSPSSAKPFNDVVDETSDEPPSYLAPSTVNATSYAARNSLSASESSCTICESLTDSIDEQSSNDTRWSRITKPHKDELVLSDFLLEKQLPPVGNGLLATVIKEFNNEIVLCAPPVDVNPCSEDEDVVDDIGNPATTRGQEQPNTWADILGGSVNVDQQVKESAVRDNNVTVGEGSEPGKSGNRNKTWSDYLWS